MDEVVIKVPWKTLRSCGPNWQTILNDLKAEGILKAYTVISGDTVECIFDKNKALHVQSILEFYESRNVPQGHSKQLKSTDKDD